ncbi:MAG: tannase/feruloyl esterase family alpha/beta hydrolase [Rubrivivax sp.]
MPRILCKPRRLRRACLALAAWPLTVAAAGPNAATPQLLPATPATLQTTCDALPAALAGLADTVITGATSVPAGGLMLAGQPVPAHCRVTGRMNDRVGPIDGRPYAIGFEIRLPIQWNGRFFHQGNGGADGSVVPATGTAGGGPRTGALLQGFAVLSSDAGHSGAYGTTFGVDPQARLDYGYQAVGTLTPMAKQAIAIAYGKGPDRSYFGGCSNGGRHTLIAAARYADDYDGFLAGAPGYNLPLAALANIFGAKQYASVATGNPATPAGLETAYTAAERRTVANAILERCDALDGAADGLVQDTKACQAHFNLNRDVPTCSGERDGRCLTKAQKAVVSSIAKGATTSTGERFYASFPYDAGIGSGGIPFWEFVAPLVLDSGAVGFVFKTPPESMATFNGPTFTLGADIDTLLAQLYATNATYTEAGMSFMTPPSATRMGHVRERGGKILVYHGVSDPIFSIEDTQAWYRGVDAHTGKRAGDFVRLYDVPGMGHCSGGPATDQADFLTPLVAWVEHGQAPGALVASARGPGNPGGVNPEVPANWAPDRTRPLCAYPSVARYVGHGDIERAASFVCTTKNKRH